MSSLKLIPRFEHFNPNFFHEVGFDLDHSVFLKTSKTRYLFVSSLNLEYAKSLIKKKDLSLKLEPLNKLFSFLKQLKSKSLELDFEHSPAYFYKRIEDLGFSITELKKDRSKKTSLELSKIKKAVKLTRELLYSLEIKKGMREIEVEKKIKLFALNNGVELSFPPIVASLRNARFPHYKTGKARIRKGVLIDVGLSYKFYTSDLTRVIFLEKGTKEEKIYEKLISIFWEIMDNFPETSGELALFAEELFKKKGLPLPPHLIGHGIGLEVHEPPHLSKNSNFNLARTTLAIEPAFYSSFGLRFEENIYVGKKPTLL